MPSSPESVPKRELPWTHPRESCAPFGVEKFLGFPVETQKAMSWCWCGWHSAEVRGPANALDLLNEHLEKS